MSMEPYESRDRDRDDRLALRNEEIAPEARLDLHQLAGLAEVVHVFLENDLHG